MATASRQRVTVDLRGAADRLHAFAAARHMTTAAVVRMVIRRALDDEQVGVDSTVIHRAHSLADRRAVKVTIRVAAEVATALADRARAADVSQGTYVTGLLDGVPSSTRPSDHAEAVAALAQSTDALAGLRVDLNAFTRTIRLVGAAGLAVQGADFDAMSRRILEHIAAASRLVIELHPSRHARRQDHVAPRIATRSP